MIGPVVVVVVVVVAILVVIGVASCSGRDDWPAATRGDIRRAERDRRADIEAALERDAVEWARRRAQATRVPPPLVVVVVQATTGRDDPRRWN